MLTIFDCIPPILCIVHDSDIWDMIKKQTNKQQLAWATLI